MKSKLTICWLVHKEEGAEPVLVSGPYPNYATAWDELEACIDPRHTDIATSEIEVEHC